MSRGSGKKNAINGTFTRSQELQEFRSYRIGEQQSGVRKFVSYIL
jgi:hypothetical protein